MNVIFNRSIDKDKKINSPKGLKNKNIQYSKMQEFCSGSKYDGLWDIIGMKGYGSFNLFYDVDYDGDFNDSMFHKRGTLIYPNNAKIDGFWDNGRMVSHRYFYSDNLCYGPYCEMPDRRYNIEIKGELKPAGRSFLTNSYVNRTIPPGCYDTGDGFYDPVKKCVYDADNPTKIVRIPSKDQHTWIINNCRKAWDEPVGYKPKLYENWQKDDSDSDTGSYYLDRLRTDKIMRKSVDYLCYIRNSNVLN